MNTKAFARAALESCRRDKPADLDVTRARAIAAVMVDVLPPDDPHYGDYVQALSALSEGE